jgi:hypothetical protein
MAPSETVSVPVRIPLAVGLKVTITVQELSEATGPKQLFVTPKSPVAVTEEKVIGTREELLTVTVCAGLVEPVARGAKYNADGDAPTFTVTPDPLSVTTCGELLALSAI